MLQAAALSEAPGIRHAFFTRAGGVSHGVYATLNGGIGSHDTAAHVAENRARMAARLGVAPARLITAMQIHSPNVVVADTAWTLEARPRADAIVTRAKGLAIGVSTADCGPLLLADPQAGVIGAAHAGWRGALAGIIEAAIDAMEGLGARRGRICAAVGPCIGRGVYQVGPEFAAEFHRRDATGAPFFAQDGPEARPRFDLSGYALHRLRQAGIAEAGAVPACNYTLADDFFSYRRSRVCGEADYGRQISAIVLT